MGKFRSAGLLGIAVVLLLNLTSPVSARNIYVTQLADDNGLCSLGDCSLREAIKVANGNDEYDTIYLPAGTIILSRVGTGEDGNNSGDLDITKSVTIVGRGPGVSIVDGNYLDRVFHIKDPGVIVIFQRMTITRGGNPSMGDGGGGVQVKQGTAVFQHCDIVNNVAHDVTGGGVQGWIDATLWFQDCSIRLNSANTQGGGIFFNSSGVLQIDRSTISQNHAGLTGGALYSTGYVGQITDSTISGNYTTSPGTGGVEVAGGNMTIEFCTLAENSEPTIGIPDFGGYVTLGRTIVHGQCTGLADHFATLGGNLETPGDTCDLSSNDLITTVNPDLGPLGLHGGPTETHRPLPTSLAVDLIFPPGVPDCTRTDQRGFSRPQDASGGVTPRCDIGAVELIHGEIFQDGLECGYTGAWSGVAP